MENFKAGKKISLTNGGDITVITKLGEGGQGTVYKVSYNGKEYALKWYFPKAMKYPDRFYKNLENNVTQGSPDKAFLWPQAVTQKQGGSFGYIMDLRPVNYVDFARILNASVHFKSTSAVLNALINMVLAFQTLHRKGYSYQDINDGNFFVDPSNGDVLICDNDNVAPHGESLGVGGKSRYMAPEVVLGNSRPNYNTDLYSLSVILFMILFVSHPLEGAQVAKCPCLTETRERKFYASEPVFIFDPDNSNNRPVRGIHNNAIVLWPLFPQYLRDMFIRAFTKGFDSNSRIALYLALAGPVAYSQCCLQDGSRWCAFGCQGGVCCQGRAGACFRSVFTSYASVHPACFRSLTTSILYHIDSRLSSVFAKKYCTNIYCRQYGIFVQHYLLTIVDICGIIESWESTPYAGAAPNTQKEVLECRRSQRHSKKQLQSTTQRTMIALR